MNEFVKTVTYRFGRTLSQSDISYLQSKLVTIDGINSIEIFPEVIKIEYVTLQLKEESAAELISNLGYPVKEYKKEKSGIYRRFINKLAKINKESFGNKKLDCCDIKH